MTSGAEMARPNTILRLTALEPSLTRLEYAEVTLVKAVGICLRVLGIKCDSISLIIPVFHQT